MSSIRKPQIIAWSQFSFVLAALGMRIASEHTANLSFLLLAGYAFFGRAQAIQALTLSWFFTIINPGIAPDAINASTGRYAVVLCAALSVFLRSLRLEDGIRVRTGTIYAIALGIFFVVHSLLFSSLVDVSLLKAISWTITMATLISAWSGISAELRDRVVRQVFGALVVLMLVSLPLVLSPIGYLKNDSGFQGVLNHPQAFGPTMALLGAWAASHMLSAKQPRWSVVCLVAACIVMAVLSEARTAGFALILGVCAAIFIGPALAGRSMRSMMPSFGSRRVHLVMGLALVGLVLSGAKLEGVVTNYLSKSGRSEAATLVDVYDRSRGGLVREMWANIQEKPIQGIGLGIASHTGDMEVSRDPIFGLPVSAPVEKGVLPIAVLEELGILGLVAVGAWILMLARRAALGGIVPISVALTALMLNMGEATLFSPGGMGMLSLILIGWALSSGQKVPRLQ